MKTLSIDIETYSDVPLPKTGVYRYCESPDFEILLFGYSVDSGPVQVVDLACGEKIPAEIIVALEDESVIKWAFNASFERICLSRFLGYPTGEYLDPESWRCSMIWAATMGLPLSLEGVGAVLGLEKQKLTEGKDCGNEYIDLNDTIRDDAVEGLVACMKEYGIEAFTFSSTWSSAVETAWLFQKAGCTLAGLIEINSQHKAFMSDEYEKAHGYLFKLN